MKTLILLILLILMSSCNDSQTNRYKSKKNAIKDGAIQRGWIPEIIPNSSFNIVETHDLDSNDVDGSLEYKEIDEERLIKVLSKAMRWKTFKFTLDKKRNLLHFKIKSNK